MLSWLTSCKEGEEKSHHRTSLDNGGRPANEHNFWTCRVHSQASVHANETLNITTFCPFAEFPRAAVVIPPEENTFISLLSRACDYDLLGIQPAFPQGSTHAIKVEDLCRAHTSIRQHESLTSPRHHDRVTHFRIECEPFRLGSGRKEGVFAGVVQKGERL